MLTAASLKIPELRLMWEAAIKLTACAIVRQRRVVEHRESSPATESTETETWEVEASEGNKNSNIMKKENDVNPNNATGWFCDGVAMPAVPNLPPAPGSFGL
jgi:hypothetical protein